MLKNISLAYRIVSSALCVFTHSNHEYCTDSITSCDGTNLEDRDDSKIRQNIMGNSKHDFSKEYGHGYENRKTAFDH